MTLRRLSDSSLHAGYDHVETDERVLVDGEYRWRWRAEQRRRRLEAARDVPFYRWELVHEDGRWLVVAMQNKLVPREP